MAIFLQIFITILTLGSLYALVTVGFTLIYSVTKVLHVAHGAVTLLGAYLFVMLANAGLPWFAAGLGAILGCGIAGALMNYGVFERLRRRGEPSAVGALIASVALLVMGSNILQLAFGPQTRVLAQAPDVARWHFAGATISQIEVVTVLVSLAIIVALGALLKMTRLGQALRAVADHAVVAEVVGINARRQRLVAFAIGSMIAGLAGVLFALRFGLEPNQSVAIGITAFIRAVIGGVGSIPGALAGNFLLETAENVGAFYFNSAFKEIFSFLAIFGFLLLRPQGLFGPRRR